MSTLRPLVAVLVLAASAGAAPPAVRTVALPFDPATLGNSGDDIRGTLSADGRTLLLCGPKPGPSDPAFRENRPCKLVLVDLDAGKVTAERVLATPVGPLAVDAHFVYAAAATADALLVLDRKTLADHRRVVLPPRVDTLVTAGDRRLLAVARGEPVAALAVPALTPVTLPTPSPRSAPAAAVGDGWWLDGVLYDAGFEKPVLVAAPAGFQVVGPAADGAVGNVAGGRPVEPNPRTWLADTGRPWGVQLDRHDGLTAAGGRKVGRVPSPVEGPHQFLSPVSTVVLTGRPLVATAMALGRWSADKPSVQTQRTEVVYQELGAAEEVVRVPLPDEETFDTNTRPFNTIPPRPVRAFARPTDELAVVVGTTLYLVPLPDIPAGRTPEPLRGVPATKLTVVAAAPSDVPLPAVRGGRPPVVRAFRQPIPGTVLDAAGGKLRVTAPDELIAWAVPLVARPMAAQINALRRATGTVPNRLDTADGQLDAYRTRTAARFEPLAGRKPAGLVVWVSVGVSVQDAALASVPADGGFFLDLPADKVRAAVEAESQKFQDAMLRPAGGDPNALRPRVELLERKVDELNRKLDAVLKVLEAQKKDK